MWLDILFDAALLDELLIKHFDELRTVLVVFDSASLEVAGDLAQADRVRLGVVCDDLAIARNVSAQTYENLWRIAWQGWWEATVHIQQDPVCMSVSTVALRVG